MTLLDYRAFYQDRLLRTANLGDRLVTIGEGAFATCTNLTDVTLPQSLITLGNWCFRACASLKTITIPNKVKDLNQGAFAYCTGLESVKIGNTVATVSGVTSGWGPGSQYFDGYGAFYGCTSLTSVTFGTGVKAIGAGAFYGCGALRSVKIPDTVTTIGNYAFGNCQSLIYATLGKGVATMGNNVFDGDKALHYVEFKGAAAPADNGGNTFANTNDRVKTYVQAGSTGWISLYESGLPDSWQGKAIAYGPVPSGAANPYDFYFYPARSKNVDWSLMLTTSPFKHNSTVPGTPATIYDDETLYLSYAFDEYYRGEPYAITNRFELTGSVNRTWTRISDVVQEHSTANFWWRTNVVEGVLQGLKPGDYMLKITLGERFPRRTTRTTRRR